MRAFRVGEGEELKCKYDGLDGSEFIGAVVPGEANESVPLLKLGANLSEEQKAAVYRLWNAIESVLGGVGCPVGRTYVRASHRYRV